MTLVYAFNVNGDFGKMSVNGNKKPQNSGWEWRNGQNIRCVLGWPEGCCLPLPWAEYTPYISSISEVGVFLGPNPL